MEIIKIKNLSFSYSNSYENSLKNINLSINEGDFVLICGETGCGKSTLVTNLKKELLSTGNRTGDVLYNNKSITSMSTYESATSIGYVMQNPENQIVTDKVWHELAFGLENLGFSSDIIRRKVAEMANFFGIQNIFREENVNLSGGQKQIINLAAIMLLQPKVLILDEPTSQLDPIAAIEFIDILKKINNDFATTIIIVEHRLEDVFQVANKVVVMDNGEIIAQGMPNEIANIVSKIDSNHSFIKSLPTCVKISLAIRPSDTVCLTIKDTRILLKNSLKKVKFNEIEIIDTFKEGEVIMELKDIYFRYTKKQDDIISRLNLKIFKNEFYALVGGNGSGKSTLLKIISKMVKAYRGDILYNNKKGKEIPYKIGYLPQDPTLLFVKDSVKEDLEFGFGQEIDYDYLKTLIKEFSVQNIMDQHPYDLSGGEQQKVALIKILVDKPELLLLDEPTKGLDFLTKEHLALHLKRIMKKGLAIISVTHDIEFCAAHANRCGLLFNGEIVSQAKVTDFFIYNNFYTTSAVKISKNFFKNTILCEDVIKLCLKNINSIEK